MATHALRGPDRTACGRDATAVVTGVPPSCRVCLRSLEANPLEQLAAEPEGLEAALEAALEDAELEEVDRPAVALLRATLRELETNRDLGDTARASLTGRAVQLLRELRWTPTARTEAAPATEEPAREPAAVDPLTQAREAAARRLSLATSGDTPAA